VSLSDIATEQTVVEVSKCNAKAKIILLIYTTHPLEQHLHSCRF
jgi:hypothetical protein